MCDSVGPKSCIVGSQKLAGSVLSELRPNGVLRGSHDANRFVYGAPCVLGSQDGGSPAAIMPLMAK
jgi:hypothetical protein